MKKIIVVGIAVILLLLLVPSISATWCNNNYGKKAPILINNTGGSEQTYYQVMLNYTYDSDMNSNFSDVRIYNESDCSLVSLWNESAVPSSYNKIWGNYSNIPASSWTNGTYWLYYNYSSAGSASNGINTFEFFDDFEYIKGNLTEHWSFESGATRQKSIPFALYDYDDDGIDDVYSVDSDGGHLRVFNWSGYELLNVSLTMHFSSDSYTCGIDVTDINEDGEEEIVYIESDITISQTPCYVFCLNSSGVELWNTSFPYKNSESIKIANFTATSGLEIVTVAGNNTAATIYMLDKDGNEEWHYDYGSLSEARGIDYGDFNGDGQNDVCSIDGAGTGFVVLYGHNGTLFWSKSGVGGETLDIKDINEDGEDDILMGLELSFRIYWGNGTLYWSQAVSDDAEWVTFSPEKINNEWLVLSTGRHQHLYVMHQNGTQYSDTNISSNSWTGTFGDLDEDGTYEIVVGKDTGTSLNVYNLNGNLLASTSEAGQTRHIVTKNNSIFITSNANPNQYAIYNYTAASGGSFSDNWAGTGTITTDKSYRGTQSVKVHGVVGSGDNIYRTESGDKVIEFVEWFESGMYNGGWEFYDSSTRNFYVTQDVSLVYKYWDGSWHNTAVSVGYDKWNKIKFIHNSNGYSSYVNGTTIVTDSGNANKATMSKIYLWAGTNQVNDVYIETYRVRKYTSPEPTAELGDEETPSVAVLEIGNNITIENDWGQTNTSNISITVSGTTANETNVTYNDTRLINVTDWGDKAVGTYWDNQSILHGDTVSNVYVEVQANTTTSGGTNDTEYFWLNTTKRTNTATMDSSATQSVGVNENFYINATCNEEYGSTFYGSADLLEDGSIIDTDASVTNYVNFSHSESVAGQYNYSLRFYNTSYYFNATTPTFSNVTISVVPVITLLEQTPSVIYQNSTGSLNISYGITHGSVGLNNTSVSFIYRNYDHDLSDSNHSIRPPSNNKSAVWDYNGRILRGANRNETLNFENNDTITGGDIYTWSGLDENNTRLTIVPVNSTYTKVYINGSLHKFMPQMWYLDRTDLQEAPKTQLGIHKTQKVLIKFWNFEEFKGNYNYLGVGYTDTILNTNPALQPSDAKPINYYYVNSSYNPTTGGDPLASGYAVYMGSLNASGWIDHVYKPHANSSYVRGFINGSLLHSYINTTEISYLYFTSNTPSSKPYYINVTNAPTHTNVSFADTNVLWAGDTAPYTPQSYTPNNWFAFMKLNMSFDQKIYAADNNNQWANSTLNSTFISKALFPPTKPTFYSFHNGFTDYDMNGTYSGIFDIQIGTSSDPDGGIVVHNLTLHYGVNNTYITTINNTFYTPNGVFADVTFDSSPYYSSDNYTLRLIATDDENEHVTVWLCVNFTLSAAEYIPPDPTNLQNETSASGFWINHTWQAGAGNITNSYNVSVNGTDYNGTTNTYFNSTGLSAHSWSNITLFAYNSSGDGGLSSGSVSDNVQLPNNPVSITNCSDRGAIETQTIYVDIDSTDADGDTPTFSCNRTDLFTDFSTSTGHGNWTTTTLDNGTYYVDFGVSDGYGSTDNCTMAITIAEGTPTAPTNLQYSLSNGNQTIEWTWTNGQNTNSIDAVLNGSAIGTITSPHQYTNSTLPRWENLSIWGYNSTTSEYSAWTNDTTYIEAPPGTYNISGYVKNTTGVAIDTAYVINNITADDDYTDATGFYNLTGLLNNTYLVTASKAGYTSNSTVVTLSGSDMINQNITLTEVAPGANITSWWNNYTSDNSTNFTIPYEDADNRTVFFNVTADQSIDYWVWYVDDVLYQNSSSDNITKTWDEGGNKTVSVYGLNANGQSNTHTWYIEIEHTQYEYTKLIYEQNQLLLEEEKMMGLSLLLALLVIVGVVFFLLGILVPHSVLTLLGSMTFFVTMVLPIPVLSNYAYFGIALTSILLLFGLIGVIITFWQFFTTYNSDKGYHKWDDYFDKQ